MNRIVATTSTALFLFCGIFLCLYLPSSARIQELPLPKVLKDCYQKAQNYTTQNYVGAQYCWYCETPVRALIKGGPTPFKNSQQK